MDDTDHDTPIRSGRLSEEEYARNFADSHPALTHNQALVESDRCYFCFDAPCIQACPTAIDIPSFIRKIATGNLQGAAHDILKQNIMGAVCARVCPTEVLCEGACVRNQPGSQAGRRSGRCSVTPLIMCSTGTSNCSSARRDRKAHRRCRRRPGRPVVCASARDAGPSRDCVRSTVQARRAERVWGSGL